MGVTGITAFELQPAARQAEDSDMIITEFREIVATRPSNMAELIEFTNDAQEHSQV
jgi:hypothetical protein